MHSPLFTFPLFLAPALARSSPSSSSSRPSPSASYVPPFTAVTTTTINISASSLPTTSIVLSGSNAAGDLNGERLLPSGSRWTFTQGFLVGQAIFVVICAVFIKYVVFEDAEASRRRRADRAKKVVMSTTNVPPPTSNEILEKTSYDMSSHGSESSDWINVLFAQVLQGYRDDLLSHGGEEGARKTMERLLNPPGSTLSWLDPITVTNLNLGKGYPLLSNARIRPADGLGDIRAEVDIDYTDALSLSVATSLLVNFPFPRFAVLPVMLGVELVSFGGTLTMQIHKTSSSDPDKKRQVHLSLLPDFHLNVKATSLLGSRAKLQDIPKLEQIVISRLQSIIQDKLVWPRFIGISLPHLVSRGEEPIPFGSSVTSPASKDEPFGASSIPGGGGIPRTDLDSTSGNQPAGDLGSNGSRSSGGVIDIARGNGTTTNGTTKTTTTRLAQPGVDTTGGGWRGESTTATHSASGNGVASGRAPGAFPTTSSKAPSVSLPPTKPDSTATSGYPNGPILSRNPSTYSITGQRDRDGATSATAGGVSAADVLRYRGKVGVPGGITGPSGLNTPVSETGQRARGVLNARTR